MKTRRFILVVAFGAVLGCRNGAPPAPLAPTTTTSVSDPCSQNVNCTVSSFRLTGVATDDDGRPVPGATVTVHPSGFPQYAPPVSATTDAAGAYALDFKATPSPVLSIGWAVAERPGHERFYRYLPPALSQEMVQNFHLYRIKRITAGETVSIVVRPDDTSCGDSDEWVCRTVRVGAGMTGRVILTLTSREASTDSGLCAVQDRPPYTYRCNSSELVYDMTAGGADLIVTIFMDWRAKESQSFTLRTAFVPYAPRLF